MAIDFLIVGGGIGGYVLANLLGRRGKHVLVLEKSRTPSPQNRPEILWPATVELLRTLIPRPQGTLAAAHPRRTLPLRETAPFANRPRGSGRRECSPIPRRTRGAALTAGPVSVPARHGGH